MELGKVEESQVDVEEKELEKETKKMNNAVSETTQENTNGWRKQSDEVNNATEEEEHQKDSMTIVEVKGKIEEVDKPLSTNIEKAEVPNASTRNRETIVSELNQDLSTFVTNEKAEPKKNDTEKSKLEGEQGQENNTKANSTPQFPSKFYREQETYDCDPGPLWHFEDPYFIDLVQVGNPPKDEAYVRLKREDDNV